MLGLQVCHPARALELDLIEGPFQPHGKGGDLLIITLGNLIEVLYENVKWGQCAKITESLDRIWAMLVVDPISAAAPYNKILSQTTASR